MKIIYNSIRQYEAPTVSTVSGGISLARVLLVDDEKNIRNGLRAIISRSGSFFSLIDECSNGAGALEMLSKQHYDLLVTDLLMPRMDGIELVSNIAGMNDKPYTVILSGHDDFKYAQKAINYGVKAYLLKPVDKTELLNILKKAEAEILSRQNGKDPQNAVQASEFFENQLALILLNENLADGEIEKILGSCELDIKNREYHIAVINFCEIYESQDKRDNNSVLNTYLKKRLAELYLEGYSFFDQKGNIVAILDKNIDLKELLDPIERMYGYKYTAGISRHGREPSSLRSSYLRAEYALRRRLLDPSERVVYFNEAPGSESKYIIPVRLLKNLAGMLDTDRKEDLCKLVYQIFDEHNIGKYPLDYLEKLSYAFKGEIIQYLSEYIPHKLDFIQEQEQAFQSLYEFVDVQAYIHYACGYVLNINNILLKMKNTYNSYDEIDTAIKYVKENYSRDLTMAEVANHICLNYSYFSLLFKGKTGMNFIDYLKKVRIEKAQELLKSSEFKIYEISAMVGYNNTKHFATTFREFTGISPKEFRDRIYIN
jgi:two-component system response regulator YesN